MRKGLIVGVIGIYVSYLLSSIFQEKVLGKKAHSPFPYFFFYSFIQAFITLLFAGIALRSHIRSLLHIPMERDPDRLKTMKRFWFIGGLYWAAPILSRMALLYIDYPIKVLFKSCKPIPVLVVGSLFFKRTYPTEKWLSLSLICVGIVLFIVDPSSLSDSPSGELVGYLLLAFSLCIDGVHLNAQSQFYSIYHPSSLHVMFYCNLYSSALNLVLVFLSMEWIPAILHVLSNPSQFSLLVLSCIFGGVGQFFVWYLMVDHGEILTVTVTTIRKFVTILLSIVIFQHSLSWLQWVGMALVFIGLIFYKVFSRIYNEFFLPSLPL